MAEQPQRHFDLVVVSATPGGIMAALAAARDGRSVVLLERTAHIGGLPANGLGATDIQTRGCTLGLFKEFVDRVRAYYVKTYGESSPQVRDCSDGYHFEPSVGERVLEAMLGEHEKVSVLRRRQFDADRANVTVETGRIKAIRVVNLQSKAVESYSGEVFVDATYEGDLAAAAGAPFRTRREGKDEYNEPLAGRVYKKWAGETGSGSTGEGDDTIQAYNYRLCLTDRAENAAAVEKPANYNREEYASLADDIRLGRHTGVDKAPHGIGWITNQVKVPNGKTDSNNQHLAFVSTDLPVENYPWPTADWAWRDQFARRLRDYTLGLIYFVQNDQAVPAEVRALCRKWGLARDEYVDNANFPRQVYVREGRRIEGEHFFIAYDALPVRPGERPPIYDTSITSSHYAIDSHAVRKREPDRVHLDGFLSLMTHAYTVPYGVIVPRFELTNLLTPVPVSGSHLGFSTLRMEPCWMAMGQAAGHAAALAIGGKMPVKSIDTAALQRRLIEQGACLIHFNDIKPDHPAFKAVQFFGVRGFIPEWEARPDAVVSDADAQRWLTRAGKGAGGPEYVAGRTTRGELLQALYARA